MATGRPNIVRGKQDPKKRPACPSCSTVRRGQSLPVLCRAGSTKPSFTYYYCPACRHSIKKPRPFLHSPPRPRLSPGYVSPLSALRRQP